MLFSATLNQLATLILFIAIGFIVAKTGILPKDTASSLSKLENVIFIPALILGTFIEQFTVEMLSTTWKLLLTSLAIEAVIIALSILVAHLLTKDTFLKNTYTYILAFANFAFLGNAIVEAIFPEHFLSYILFTIPLWVLIYVWGIPYLLTEQKTEENERGKIQSFFKRLFTPMFICLIIGAVIGLSGLKIPAFLMNTIQSCGACMSPIAMLITGITLAHIDVRKVFSIASVYWMLALRLLIFPLILGGAMLLVKTYLFDIPEVIYICFICSITMPTGMNTVIIPAAQGKDTSISAGLSLVSHILSLATIPFIFWLFF